MSAPLPPPSPRSYVKLWLASVDNDTVKQTTRVPINSTVIWFFVWRSVTAGDQARSFVRSGEPLHHVREMAVSRSIYGKAPTRQLHSTPTAVSGVDHTGK